jgi:hypothetical protein
MRYSKILILLGALLIIMVSATGCSGSGSVTIPIKIENADNIGAIALELVYNATVLRVIDVNIVDMSQGAESGYNTDTPGKLILIIQNAPDINGSGTLVDANFEVLTQGGGSALTLQNVQARDLTTLQDIPTSTIAGSYQVADNAVISPVIVFGQ